MRFLHVSAGYWPFRGGAERFLQEISERLVQDGHEVTVLCSDALSAENYWIPGKPRVTTAREVVNGVEVRRCRVEHLMRSSQTFPNLRRLGMMLSTMPGTLPLLRRMGRFLPWMPAFEAVLSELGPFDLVHSFNISLEAPILAAWRYARQHRLPFVTSPFVHTGVPGDRFVERHYTMRHQLEVLKGSDLIFVMSDIEGKRLAELGVPPERLSRLGVGIEPVEVPAGAETAFRRKYGIMQPFVAFIGSITRDKGAVHLVEACRRLWEQKGRDFDIVMAGIPVTEFDRYYRDLPDEVQQRVHLLGTISEEDKWAMLAACEMLAMPSRVDSFGIVYLEAWTQGKPVIGARAGGVPDVISEDQDGLLVPYGDIEALGGGIASLLDNPERGNTIGHRGRRKVITCYSWARIYSQLLEASEQLIFSHNQQPTRVPSSNVQGSK